MRYYLTRYTGIGTVNDRFRPLGEDEVERSHAIDLRPDSTVTDGFAVFACDETLPARAGRVVLTDDPDDATTATRDRLASRLGLNVDALPFRRLVMHLLRDHGDDASPSRWNRLRPAARLLPDGRRARALEVWLGELLSETIVAADGPGTTLADDFNRADGTVLGGSWTEVDGDWTIASNRLRSPTTGANAARDARWEANLAGVDHYSQAIFWANGASTNAGGPAARFDSAARTYYAAQILPSSSGAGTSTRIVKMVAGTLTSLGNGDILTIANQTDYLLKTEVNGSTLTGSRDGVTFKQVTDVTITTGTRAGVAVTEVTNLARFWNIDDWQAADLGVAAVERSVGFAAGALLPAIGAVSIGASD